VKKYIIVPDEKQDIKDTIIDMSDNLRLDLILTTGGTGFSPRDVTPEATIEVIDRIVPGIPEAMRARSLLITPKAMLSRAQAGIRKQTLIINLPGSPKGVRENLEVIIPALKHGIEILTGQASECGGK
jgi:molybdenum cofactor synthesis domain-containing protein